MCTQSPHSLPAKLLCVCRSLQICAFPCLAAPYRYNVDRVVLCQCFVPPVKACSAVYNFMSILLIYCPLKLYIFS